MPTFDDAVDALGVVEDHATNVLDLEEARGKELMKVYERVARQLHRRLARYPVDSFSAQQIRVTLIQLDGALQTFNSDLQGEVKESARQMWSQGLNDMVDEVDAFDTAFEGAIQPVNVDLALTASDLEARLFNKYDASIAEYSASLRQNLGAQLRDLVIQRRTPEAVYQSLITDNGIARFFASEAWRLRRIVRTEMHGMYGTAKLEMLGRYVDKNPTMRKALYHPLDARTAPDSMYVRSLHLRPRVEKPFRYTWRGVVREFMAPPDRPNDRSILIPFDPSWVD